MMMTSASELKLTSRPPQHFGGEHEYLGFLRDSPSAAQRLCHVLSNSRYLGVERGLFAQRHRFVW